MHLVTEPGSGDARFRLRGHRWYLLILLVIIFSMTPACSREDDLTDSPVPLRRESTIVTITPFQPYLWTQTPTPHPRSPTPSAPPFSLWLDFNLPESLLSGIELPPELGFNPSPDHATFRLEIGDEQQVSTWIYALVAPFPTVIDDISFKELRQTWNGKASGVYEEIPLRMEEATQAVLSVVWGEPKGGSVEVHQADELLEIAWEQRPSWAIVPFEQLNPKWKVLKIDGISPIQNYFNPSDYRLTIPISLQGEGPIKPLIPITNRDPEKLTTLVMTGVTALVRGTAFTMEQQGITYPARDLRDVLREADITHISNEVPFASDCPYPNPVQVGMIFCSADRYIELLDYIGTDIIELTGDHFSDWGPEAMLHTLELYDQRSWLYYGGGASLEQGRKPKILSHHGNKIAFIGCNAKGGGYAHASSSTPGAVACDLDWMVSKIQDLKRDGYLPVATFQHFEYYTYNPQPNQVSDARTLTKAGAVIVSGSQAHQPQGMEFSDNGFIHHGLGNLFFDQLDVTTATRQAFIDRHIFYDGRYISTELITIWFEDYARARLMTAEEREALLSVVFQASGW